jgi:hypothetical protein
MHTRGPNRVKTGNTQNEHKFSGPPPKADSRFVVPLIVAATACTCSDRATKSGVILDMPNRSGRAN